MSDQELFQEAAEAETLDKFENPEVVEAPPSPKEDKPKEPERAEGEAPEPTIPNQRLREESEARRRAERENIEIRARLAAFEAMQQARPQQQAPKVDIFDNPSAFVRQEMESVIREMRAEIQQRDAERQFREELRSAEQAAERYGKPTVDAARSALEQGMMYRDPDALATYNRAMASYDPYGVITRWHKGREDMKVTGGDLESYVQKRLQEAMGNPDIQRQFMDAMRGTARQVNRPASLTQPTFSESPSLSELGQMGTDNTMQDNVSDAALFRQATSAKRRR